MKKWMVKFQINDGFWLTPGKIIFNEDYCEIKFLGKTKIVLQYTQIMSVEKTRYFLNRCIAINTKNGNVRIITGLNHKKIVDQFIGLGFL